LNLKNYTSEVPVTRSVSHIEEALVKAGARDIYKTYGPTGKLDSVCFALEVSGQKRAFRLPSRVDKVYDHLKKAIKRPRPGTKDRLEDQAARTAWKILSDWVDVQISLVILEQAELAQVFLAYMWDPNKMETMYDKLKGSSFKMLTYNG
jgi:hypothetical protein